MAESTTITGGPSLEQILWRAMDRYTERPGLVDADEFAEHLFGVFDGDLPAEAWVARFFEGDKLKSAPTDVAEAIVKATRQRLHVYEFDLNRLEYVIIEDEEKVVVVSDFGQFALKNDDIVSRAIESAVVPSRPGTSASQKGAEPRAVFVRWSGEVVTVDVKKVARALEHLMVKQVSMPAIDRPQARIAPVASVRRSQLSEAREAKALRQDLRARQPLAMPKGSEAAPLRTTLFLVMPDGTLAKPSIGSATRWQQMVGPNAGSAAAVPVAGQRFSIQSGNVLALIQPRANQLPGSAGARALAGSEALSAVRGELMQVRTLSDAALARALSQGAMAIPGLARGDDFWVQPERAFKPRALDDKTYSQHLSKPVVAQPLQLGELSGDPWAGWALTGGGQGSIAAMAALRGRSRSMLRAALDRPDDDSLSAMPGLAERLRGVGDQALQLAGESVVGFRAPDGSVILNRATGAIRLAAIDRNLQASSLLADAGDPQLSGAAPLQDLPFGLPGIAARSGALPETALSSLQFALERTAMAGGYRMPIGRIESASDAFDFGNAVDASLDAGDPRHGSIQLAGPIALRDGSSGQVAQLVLSMPFPNEGELHVGTDLNEALQAYLAAPIQPTPSPSSLAAASQGGSILLRLRGGQLAQQTFDAGPFDWSGLHQRASLQARDAVVTLDLPEVQSLLPGSSTVSGLPFLLRRALSHSGEWIPGPGAPMPTSIRELALSRSFDLQSEVAAPAQLRPVNPGEDEIVIPMPLWAQMGRGQLSETSQIMASPLAPTGYAPRLGAYRLMVPAGGPVDLTGGNPDGTPGGSEFAELTGPTALELQARSTRSPVVASSLGGRQIIGRVAIDDGQSAVGPRGRLPIAGAMNLAAPAAADLASTASSFVPDTGSAAPAAVPGPSSAQAQPVPSVASPSVVSPAGTSSPSSAASVSGQPAASGSSGTFVDGSFKGAPGSGMQVPALRSALQMSSDVSARTASPGSLSSASVVSSGAQGSAAAATVVSSGAAGSGSLPTAARSDQELVSAPAIGTDASGGAIGSDTSTGPSGSPANNATQVSKGSAQTFTGLSPGMWSGARRGTVNYQPWSYAPGRQDTAQTSDGGVSLSGLARPLYPSLPTSLRFRYVGAPLWWSSATPGIGQNKLVTDGPEEGTPAGRALRSGLRAANSAATLWRSILVSSPQSGGGSAELSSIDAGHDASADQMSSLSRRFDSLSLASLVASGAAPSATASAPAYIAMNGQGSAGLTTGSAAARAKADSVEMRIVAAIPPSPPPLESMGSGGARGGDAPHARGKRAQAESNDKKDDSVSASKIEGSVDAIAQRIYHRIRRRIQSDRERFGG